MEQTVYIDLYFLINMSMDVLCFFITSRLLSHKLSLPRTLCASALGGVYACAALIFGLEGIFGVIADLGFCLLMCAVAVVRRGERSGILGYSIVYCAASIVLGGAMTVIFSFMNRLGIDNAFGEGEDGISVWIFALLAMISGAMSLLGVKRLRKKGARERGRIEISYAGKTVLLDAITDSGNTLSDPISALPCIVVDKGCAASLLSDAELELIGTGNSRQSDSEELLRVRIIPARTALGSGIMYAIRPDKVRVDMGKGWHSANALIAFGEVNKSKSQVRALIPTAVAMGAP